MAVTKKGTAFQFRGGTTIEHSVFTGLPREVTINTDTNTPVIHDGVTPGGHPLKGDKGDSFIINASGLFSARAAYDEELLGFVFFATDQFKIYFRDSVVPGSWSAGYDFGRGEKGDKPLHSWNGTELRFENPDGSFGVYVNLKGDTGEKGDKPAHAWTDTSIAFENPDGSPGTPVDLKGATGEKGDKPSHTWTDTALAFENPDGSTGDAVDLKGDKGDQGIQGIKGDKPAHTWTDTALSFENPDGSPGTSVDLKGATGEKGDKPAHTWSSTFLQFENPDGSLGAQVDLKGDKGDRGDSFQVNITGLFAERSSYDNEAEGFSYLASDQGNLYIRETATPGVWSAPISFGKGETGEKGDKPAHSWSGTALTFENPDGSLGDSVDLKGEKGDTGDTGSTGDEPAHQWNGTELQFQNPDGSWGAAVDLKGDKGDTGATGPANPDSFVNALIFG